jgi:hypothetical protein
MPNQDVVVLHQGYKDQIDHTYTNCKKKKKNMTDAWYFHRHYLRAEPKLCLFTGGLSIKQETEAFFGCSLITK